MTSQGKALKGTARFYIRGELAALGPLATAVQVTVGEDKIHGTSAVIGVQLAEGTDPETLKTRVAEILARYTIHYQVILEGLEGTVRSNNLDKRPYNRSP